MKKKKVSISHIAKELDISPSTVSRALSGSGRIHEQRLMSIWNHMI